MSGDYIDSSLLQVRAMQTTENQPTPILLRLPQVLALVGLKRSWIYSSIRRGEFPPPIKLGRRATVWMQSTIVDWIERQAAHPPSDITQQPTTRLSSNQAARP